MQSCMFVWGRGLCVCNHVCLCGGGGSVYAIVYVWRAHALDLHPVLMYCVLMY